MDVLDVLREDRVASVVRANKIPNARALADAIAAVGVRCVEFTFTTPNCCDVLRAAAGTSAVLGAGTVLSAADAHAAIDAGAAFLVTPAVSAEVARVGTERGVPVMLGALTPTEVFEAQRLGSAAIKVFPAFIGGPSQISALRGPFPQLDFLPSGGVNPGNARAFLDAGALAVFAGSELAPPALVEAGDLTAIAERAAQYVAAVS